MLKGRKDPGAAGLWVVIGAALMSALMAGLTGDFRIPRAAVAWTVAAGAVEGIYFASLLTALAHLPLPLAYGVSRGAGVLLAWPIAMLWAAESASPAALLGAVLLSLGLASVALDPAPSGPHWADRRRGWLATWFCACSIAAYPLVYKQALSHGAAPFALFSVSLALSLPIQLAWLGRSARARLAAERQQSPAALLAAAGLCAASFLMLLTALNQGGAAHLSALRNTSVILATALAARQQPLSCRDWVRAGLVTLGALLVAW